MQRIKKAGAFLLDAVEIYIPTAAFIIMFISFIIQVFFRYVVRSPLTWSYELCQMSFLWAGILGACFTLRKNEHVVFGLVYDGLGQKGKCVCDIIAGLICVAALGLLMLPTYKYLMQISNRYPATIKVPFSLIFLPFFLMIVVSIARFAMDIYRSIAKLARGCQGREGGNPA